MAAELTTNDVDEASRVGSSLDQVAGSLVSFTGDGAYGPESNYGELAARHPCGVVVLPRSCAVPSEMAEMKPTQPDGHLQLIA